MRLLKRAECTLEFGGPDSGWRPQGAAPYPSQSKALTLEIRSSSEGYFLLSIPNDGSLAGDTWHRTVEEALSQAELQFGVASSSWQEVSA